MIIAAAYLSIMGCIIWYYCSSYDKKVSCIWKQKWNQFM